MKQLLLILIIFGTSIAHAQWEQLVSGTNENLNEVFFPAQDTGYVVGAGGTVLKTVNGGNTWNALTTGYDLDFYELYFLSTDEGWIVGDSGIVCRTTNGGTNWNCTFTPDAENIMLHSIYARNSDDVWIGGLSYAGSMEGYIGVSDNGGMTWNEAEIEQYLWDIDIKKIGMTSATTGYAATRGDVLKTTDGGMTWEITDTASVHAGTMFVLLEDLAFFPNNDTVYTCGWYGGYFGKTTNGGDNWQHNEAFQNYNLDFLNPQVGYIGGWCHLHKTTDGGATFVDAAGESADLFCDIYSIDFTDEARGYACGYEGKILRTSNGGGAALDTYAKEIITAFPNPVTDVLHFSSAVNGNLTDCSGKNLYMFTSIESLQLENLASGIYFLNLSNSDKNTFQSLRIVKE